MIRAILALTFWSLIILIGGIFVIPFAVITGRVDYLWNYAVYCASAGVRLSGVRVSVVGREQLDPASPYIFMSNHQSNIDPPIVVKAIGRQISILTKKELFRIPLFGTAMRMTKLVPVDRRNREAAIESVRIAVEVLQSGRSMLVYPEGTRSRDGRLLPFKKGPFHMAMEAGVSVAPITLIGAHEAWPKGRFAIRPGVVTVVFHKPIDPAGFRTREELMEATRATIESALPAQYQSTTSS